MASLIARSQFPKQMLIDLSVGRPGSDPQSNIRQSLREISQGSTTSASRMESQETTLKLTFMVRAGA
jgi:hypothetical protein